MTNAEASAVDLLLQRLTWPSGLVRERACASLASLMEDIDFGAETVSAVLAWMAMQTLESVAVLGLLAFFRAKSRGVAIPTQDAVSQKLVKPSLLSWLITRTLYDEFEGDPPVSQMHSETAPSRFEPDPFFLRYAKAFLPPVYLESAIAIDTKYGPGFLTQWKFEWAELVERTGSRLSRPDVTFWMNQDHDHLVCVDFPMSEVYRSAFMRAIAWAADKRLISPSRALWMSAETCPIDLGFWNVLPGTQPEKWPNCGEGSDSVDTVPGELAAEVAGMWQRQLAAEWVIAEAGGRVAEGSNSVYDLEILGVIQACNGPRDPDVATIFDEGAGHAIAEEVEDLLVFGGGYNRQRADKYEEHYADWSILRLSAAGRPTTVSTWQWWRFWRGVWLPSPFLAERRFEFRCDTEALVIEENGRELARWTDWTHQLREMTTANLTPSSGQMLMMHRSVVDRESAKLGGTYAWICRIMSYHRKYSYRDFEKADFVLDFGTTRIVQG